MAGIPETGEFSFSDVIAEFGDLATAAGRDKNLMSSYLGLVPGLPTTPPLKLSDFRGQQAALVLKHSDLSATQKQLTSIASMFMSYFEDKGGVAGYKNFKLIIDEDRTDTLYTGATGYNEDADGIWGMYGYIPIFNSDTELTIEVRANITGRHAAYRSSISDVGVTWTNSYAANTVASADDLVISGGPDTGTDSGNWGQTTPRPGIYCERDCNIVRYSGTIRGGNYGSGDVRIAYSEYHGVRRIRPSTDSKFGTVDIIQYTGARFTANILVQGLRSAGSSPGVLRNGSTTLNTLQALDAIVSNEVMGTDTAKASAKISAGVINFTYSAGKRSGGGARQLPYNKPWMLTGHKPGYDVLITISRLYKISTWDTGLTPEYVRGGLQSTNVDNEYISYSVSSQPAILTNNYSVSVTEG